MKEMSTAYSLRMARKARGLSQQEAASKVGVERTYLSNVETGKVCPSLVLIRNLFDAYGMKVSEKQISEMYAKARREPSLDRAERRLIDAFRAHDLQACLAIITSRLAS